MCVLFLAIRRHPDYPLIIAANRDEYYDRPSREMHYWPEQATILAGRDLQSSGTWLGLNRAGRFCAVTNLHRRSAAPKQPAPPCSRGELVARYLRGQDSEHGFRRFLADRQRDFKPFNLVFGTLGALHTFSTADATVAPLCAGFHAISNGPLDQVWPKMSRGVARLADVIDRAARLDSAALLSIMQDADQAPDALLPGGNGTEKDRRRSAIFVRGVDYGTRTTTLLLYSKTQVRVEEVGYDGGVERSGRCFLIRN